MKTQKNDRMKKSVMLPTHLRSSASVRIRVRVRQPSDRAVTATTAVRRRDGSLRVHSRSHAQRPGARAGQRALRVTSVCTAAGGQRPRVRRCGCKDADVPAAHRLHSLPERWGLFGTALWLRRPLDGASPTGTTESISEPNWNFTDVITWFTLCSDEPLYPKKQNH